MLIHYPNGTKLEGLLLSQGDGVLRVAAKGVNDALVFQRVSGGWVAESQEPVRIELEWQRAAQRDGAERAECLYSQDLAERLLRLLRSHGPPPNPKWISSGRRVTAGRAAGAVIRRPT
ncbi:MAG TPA: hypothetical protein VME43_28840 [Bryobacteraceae bacterium]|nr:hypothetical protein [Bryobacteraceae bacterium]